MLGTDEAGGSSVSLLKFGNFGISYVGNVDFGALGLSGVDDAVTDVISKGGFG